MDCLTPEQVLFLHARLVEETSGSHGVRDIRLLLSAVARPQGTFESQDLYKDKFAKAAALMDSVIRNHPFIDGNKRTGIAAASLFLTRNGHRLVASNEDLIQFALACAQSQLSIKEMTAYLQNHSQLKKER